MFFSRGAFDAVQRVAIPTTQRFKKDGVGVMPYALLFENI